MAEYYRWIFENSVPGLPEAAAKEGLTPLAYMRKYGSFEIMAENYIPYEKIVMGLEDATPDNLPLGYTVDAAQRVLKDGQTIGVMVDGQVKVGFSTPSRKLEFYQPTLAEWGWTETEYIVPHYIKSHVHPDQIDRSQGEMLLLPTFRLPTLIHTRSANAKWLYEISHRNPVWMNPQDAQRIGVDSNDLIKVETEIGYFVTKVWVTEGIKPGIIAMSHHLGRWRTHEHGGLNPMSSALVELDESTASQLAITQKHGARAYESADPDTARIWWEDVGVHQNITHAVHPDPISGMHCWHQKALNVTKAGPHDRNGDIRVDSEKGMAVYREWVAMTRPAPGPGGLRRPLWLTRPLKPHLDQFYLEETK